MEKLILVLLVAAASGCRRDPAKTLMEITTRDGTTSAHWIGAPVTLDRGEPQAPPSYGVRSLYFTFAGDPRPHPFKPTGELFFSDWSFDIFSPDQRRVALLQSHYGPIDIVTTARLPAFLDGRAPPDERIVAPIDSPSGMAPVVDQVRWLSPTSIELRIWSEPPRVIRHDLAIAGARAPHE